MPNISDILAAALPEFGKAVFSQPTDKAAAQKLSVRPLAIRGETVYQAESIRDNKAMHQLWKEFQNCEGDFHENVGIISSYMIQYIDEGLMTWDDVTNIGDIIAGKAPGRTSHDESILFCMGGMPVSDVAWGTEVYNKALEMGIGTKLNLWDEPYKL